MENYICETCGVQYESSDTPPNLCKICNEEWQYVNHTGKSWTTLDRLINAKPYKNFFHIHEDDRQWVSRPSEKIVIWSGESHVLREGLVLHRLGGHFKGGAVLEWQNGFSGKGVLLSGDIVRLTPGHDWTSFM